MTKDYQTTVHTLFQRPPIRRDNLQVIEECLEKSGNPHCAYPIIHVAGTNGKGSVCAKVAAALQSAGYKVGLFTSPHLFEMQERISVNGAKISKEKVVEYDIELEALMDALSLKLTFFECLTWMGLRYFKEAGVDVAVIETGIGGTLDATNIIQPILSIITSLSIDHVEYLEDTLEKIGAQKAGIIKSNIPVVLGPRANFPVFVHRAKQVSAPIHLVEKTAYFYDTENRMTARRALEVLSEQFTIRKKDIEKGLSYTLPCRFEKRGNVIFDVAHNPGGFARLAEALEFQYPNQRVRFLIGMSKVKDIKQCLMEIDKKIDHIHFVWDGRDASATTEELGNIFQTISTRPFSLENSIAEGMERAKAATPKGKILVVCGSFYIMAAARPGVYE